MSMDCCWWRADAPLTPFVMGGRPEAFLAKSAGPSGLPPFVQGPFGVGRLRGAGGFDQPFSPPTARDETPLVWGPGWEVTVEADELEVVDETDDDELDRWRVLRCINMLMPRGSSDGFIEFSGWPPLIHPGRLRLAKLGGFATAVMGTAGRETDEGGEGGRCDARCLLSRSGRRWQHTQAETPRVRMRARISSEDELGRAGAGRLLWVAGRGPRSACGGVSRRPINAGVRGGDSGRGLRVGGGGCCGWVWC